jgi:two-component system, chemotaxis family, CheB/CheR fusion protein
MSVGAPVAKLEPGSAPLAADPDYFKSALFAAIVESSDDAIVSKTLEGRILSWNSAASRIFGYQEEEVIGKPITIIIPPELHAEERQILTQIKRGERIDHYDTIRVTKDGRRIPVSLTISPVRSSSGEIIGASKIARDISERKRTEEMLRQGEEALREADRRKDEFLALLAHELRNPLAPIRYALAASKKTECTPAQRARAEEIIDRQLAQMSRLLDDLLDVSRIARGKLELKKKLSELSVAVSVAAETARPLFNARQQEFHLDLPAEPLRLYADPDRLAQIFANLLVNAAKYTDAGGHISLRALRDGEQVVICVRDSGIGISAEMLPRLFTMFSQAHTALGRAEGGLGLGLWLVRALVSLHGGSIEARSDGPGRGSEFIVRIPVGLPAEERSPVESVSIDPQVEGGLKVLVVDDNRDAADTCAMLLELSGHHVQTAYGGRRALELAEAFRPHAILLDIGLPDINGYELAQRIRATSWGSDITLVAVTGWGQTEDRQRATQAGFTQHLVKPIAADSLDSLLRALGATLRGAKPESALPQTP